MTKKGKVPFVRSQDFESVDEALTAAIADLDEANLRIQELLESQSGATAPENGEEPADGLPEPGGEDAGPDGVETEVPS